MNTPTCLYCHTSLNLLDENTLFCPSCGTSMPPHTYKEWSKKIHKEIEKQINVLETVRDGIIERNKRTQELLDKYVD